jgi:hypothetical protein
VRVIEADSAARRKGAGKRSAQLVQPRAAAAVIAGPPMAWLAEIAKSLSRFAEAYANQRATPASKMPNAVWPCIDHSDFKAEIPHIAYRYTLLPALHAKRISDFLCRALLDSEIYPLARDMDNPATVLSKAVGPGATFYLQKHARGGGWATAGAILLILMAIIFALAGVFDASVVFLGLAFWIFISKFKKRTAIGSAVAEMSLELRNIHRQLTKIRDEIGGGSYDGATIVNRLKVAETSGAYVPSIIYSLLYHLHNGVNRGWLGL